jgi:hypothetical protein
MRVYLFQSGQAGRVCAYSSDVVGLTLPLEYGPWRAVAVGTSWPADALSPDVVDAIRQDGHYLLVPKTDERS